MARVPQLLAAPQNLVVSLASMASLGPTLTNLNARSTLNAWPAANRAIFVPFVLEVPCILEAFGWENGATVSGNVDVGIYDSSKSLVINKGSTAQAGISSFQTVSVAATWFDSGFYWLAMALDNATGTVRANAFNVAWLNVLGIQQAATAFPLPASPTFANAASSVVPYVAASFTPLAVM